MVKYKNISCSAKTFYGVTFKPGDVKEVPGYINCQGMTRIFGIAPVSANKTPTYDSPKRGRKKSSESEKDSNAETETKIENSKEEESNGNPS